MGRYTDRQRAAERIRQRPRRSTAIGPRPLDRTASTEAPVAPARAARSRPLPDNARSAATPELPLALDWLIVALAVAIFVGVAAHQWRLPGLYNDEAYDVIPAMQLVLGQPVELNRGVGLRLFGRDLPLMISDYQGVSSMYAVLPLFALFGPGMGPVRALTIGFGALGIVLTYLLGCRLYGRRAGLVAAILLSTSPSYIFWSRVGVYVVSQVVPLALGAALAWLRWRRGGRVGWLALAGLLAGIGFSTKILFIWFILGAAAAGVAVWLVDWRWPIDARGAIGPHRPLRRQLARSAAIPRGAVVATLGGFLVGAAPLIAYNVASAGTLKVVRANLGQTEQGVDNSAFLANLLGRLGAFRTVLEGSYFWFLGDTHANRLALPAFLGCLAALVALVCAAPAYRHLRAATVWVATLGLAILVQSAFTLSSLEATHLLILLPFPFILCGAGVALGGDWLAARFTGRHDTRRFILAALPALALTLALGAGNLLVDANYHRSLAQTGGKSSFSASIYELAQLLDGHKGDRDPFNYRRPYALDWGMRHNIQLLTDGRVEPQEIYGQGRALPADFTATLDRLFADPNALYLAHRATGENIPAAYPNRTLAFLAHAEARGKRVIPVKVINEPGGAPLFYVYSVRDP